MEYGKVSYKKVGDEYILKMGADGDRHYRTVYFSKADAKYAASAFRGFLKDGMTVEQIVRSQKWDNFELQKD